MKNPLTTIWGAIAALGTALSHVPGLLGQIAQMAAAAALALLGLNAKDKTPRP